MSNNKKLLTIAIPNYNGGENLKSAILSCANLTLSREDYEILVVDNCSTDNSTEIVKRLEQEFENIRLVANSKNIGRIGNWNKCLEEIESEYVLFLFSNEKIYKDNNIEELLEILMKNKCGVAISPFVKEKGHEKSIEGNMVNEICIQKAKDFCVDKIASFELPFAPIQKNIYSMKIIKDNKLRFLEEYDLNGDQYFSFNVAFNSKNILLNNVPQIIWTFNDKRFHSKVTINKVITDDLKLIKKIECDYNLNINYSNILAIAITRVIYNKEWNNKDRNYAFITIFNESNGIKIKTMYHLIKKIIKKLLRYIK